MLKIAQRKTDDGANVLVDISGGAINSFYVTPGLDANMSFTKDGQTSYFSQDGLNSVRTLTDSTGVAVNNYDYLPFGTSYSPNTTTTIDQRYTYTGREKNAVAPSMYYRNRNYSTTSGRFGRRDPIGYEAGSNLYSYVKGRSTLKTDPYGLCGECGHIPCICALKYLLICLQQDPSHQDDLTTMLINMYLRYNNNFVRLSAGGHTNLPLSTGALITQSSVGRLHHNSSAGIFAEFGIGHMNITSPVSAIDSVHGSGLATGYSAREEITNPASDASSLFVSGRFSMTRSCCSTWSRTELYAMISEQLTRFEIEFSIGETLPTPGGGELSAELFAREYLNFTSSSDLAPLFPGEGRIEGASLGYERPDGNREYEVYYARDSGEVINGEPHTIFGATVVIRF